MLSIDNPCSGCGQEMIPTSMSFDTERNISGPTILWCSDCKRGQNLPKPRRIAFRELTPQEAFDLSERHQERLLSVSTEQ